MSQYVDYHPWMIKNCPQLFEEEKKDNLFEESEGYLGSKQHHYGYRRKNSGKLHRLGYPAIFYPHSGSYKFYQEGKLHRGGDLPAILMCSREKVSVLFFNNDNLHRNNGPAILKLNKADGKILEEQYFVNGQKFNKEDVDKTSIFYRDFLKGLLL